LAVRRPTEYSLKGEDMIEDLSVERSGGQHSFRLKSNIIYNFAGSAWAGILTLLVTPFQVHFLGVEAFGLVGLITVLQVLLGTFDLGISATVTKVVSSDHTSLKIHSANPVNTASTVYWGVAVLIALLLWFDSDTVASFWLTRTHLDAHVVSIGIRIIAVYLGMRWPVAFYAGVISGLQRMDILNVIKAAVQTLRLVGGVVVLLFYPNLLAFLAWFAFSSAVELATYAAVTYHLFPNLRLWPRFTFASFKNIWRYSAAMNLVAITALVLSQADRVAVSKLLSLKALGYYSVAYNLSIAISLVQTAINSASFPALSYSHSAGHDEDLRSRYSKMSELTGVLVALPCAAFVFFGREILSLWVGASVAKPAMIATAWLGLGFFLNAMSSNAYIAAVACGKPRLPLFVSLIGAVFYLPGLYWAVTRFGIGGAGAAYATLNAFYIATLVPLVQAQVIRQSYGLWLVRNLIPFAVAGTAAFGLVRLVPLEGASVLKIVGIMSIGAIFYAVAAVFIMSRPLRQDLLETARHILSR
jgi:O-antigen/teichoic acid export membrane protein